MEVYHLVYYGSSVCVYLKCYKFRLLNVIFIKITNKTFLKYTPKEMKGESKEFNKYSINTMRELLEEMRDPLPQKIFKTHKKQVAN